MLQIYLRIRGIFRVLIVFLVIIAYLICSSYIGGHNTVPKYTIHILKGNEIAQMERAIGMGKKRKGWKKKIYIYIR